MKRLLKFSRAFLGCAIFSAIVIICGIIGICLRGINFGIDFRPGLIEEVRIAPAAVEVTYSGSATVSIDAKNNALDVVVSGSGADNETVTLTFGQHPTVFKMADALNGIDGIKAVVRANGDADSYGIFVNNAVTARLSSDVPYRLYVPDSASKITVDNVRTVLEGQDVSLKELGDAANRSFQIRAKISDDSVTNQTLQRNILSALQQSFGENNVAIIKTDFVASSFSSRLAGMSVLLAVCTVLLIWLYATVRFHWDFALGAIVALLHDCLIMFTFIAWFQIEFSPTTLAAVLTIFGYSINATVVILDRVRENLKFVKTRDFRDILDRSLSDTLSRSIITTVTTLFASISLLVFTTGSIHDFAIVLTIGLLSGCYSSLFISSGFIAFMRRHWEPGENADRVRPKKSTPHTVVMPASN